MTQKLREHLIALRESKDYVEVTSTFKCRIAGVDDTSNPVTVGFVVYPPDRDVTRVIWLYLDEVIEVQPSEDPPIRWFTPNVLVDRGLLKEIVDTANYVTQPKAMRALLAELEKVLAQ